MPKDDFVPVTGIRLRKDGKHTVVDAEIGGTWIEVIRELSDNEFCHVVEQSGMMDAYYHPPSEAEEWQKTAHDNAMQVLAERNAELAERLAAAEAGPSIDYQRQSDILAIELKATRVELQTVKNATIERCAQYHDKAAEDCEKIAAVNMDNKLGADCLTRAQDHREDAAAIRAMKEKP